MKLQAGDVVLNVTQHLNYRMFYMVIEPGDEETVVLQTADLRDGVFTDFDRKRVDMESPEISKRTWPIRLKTGHLQVLWRKC